MTEAENKKISLLLKKYVPEFLSTKYPMFVDFLRAYYDWSYNVKGFNPWRVVSHLVEWGDVDETLDEFILYFKEEYLNNLNTDFNGDTRSFIKHMKEFYSSRGTSESFRFLLRLLSGNSGTIFYPNRYLMKSSDGEWTINKYVFVKFDDRVTSDFLSTKIQGKYSGATAFIESIETHFNYINQKQFLKIQISNIQGTFLQEPIVFKNDKVELEIENYSTVKKINIISGGNNYEVGDNVHIADDPTFIARVSSVGIGKVDSYAILNGGSGYSVGDEVKIYANFVDNYYALPKVYVDEVDAEGAITSLDIRYAGYGFYKVPEVKEIPSIKGKGAQIEFISNECGNIREIEVISAEINYSDDTSLIIDSDTGFDGEATLSVGPVFESVPYYYKDGSFLSDVFKLQDSDYWQDYSYEIQSTLTLESELLAQFADYKEIFKRLVHPAGFKLFNSFILSNHISLSTMYINSTIDIHNAPSFLDLVNWIEMVSYWNRIVDHRIIFEYRFDQLENIQNRTLDSFTRVGGEYIHSTLETAA